jgi:hypothetical protein
VGTVDWPNLTLFDSSTLITYKDLPRSRISNNHSHTGLCLVQDLILIACETHPVSYHGRLGCTCYLTERNASFPSYLLLFFDYSSGLLLCRPVLTMDHPLGPRRSLNDNQPIEYPDAYEVDETPR